MKKQYIRPTSQVYELLAESLLAASQGPKVDINQNTSVGADASFSGEGGWSSSNWTDNEE